MADPDLWSLHPTLEQDTLFVGDLGLSRLLLMDDANFPWLLLVPRRTGAGEIVDLDAGDRAALMDEIAATSHVLHDLTDCKKLNVAALGNVVPQLHVHVIARTQGDLAWPRPVWGAAPAQPYGAAEAERFVAALWKGMVGRI